LKFPVDLHIIFPPNDEPLPVPFQSYDDIADFLSPKALFQAPNSPIIRRHNVKAIDPTKAYEIIGPGYVRREKGLREQVWDKVFEEKSKLALKAKLQRVDPDVVDLPRKVLDQTTGKDIAEWEAIFRLSNGRLVFLEAKYRMTLVSELLLKNIPWFMSIFLHRLMLISKRSA
jgi:hypothetical protein